MIVSIPKSYMGTTLEEVDVKSGLQEMNPELHFDMGAALNLWHPFMDTRQNIYYRGNSICGMDRRTLPETPVWSTKRDMVEIPWWEVKPHEIAVYPSEGVTALCHKCQHRWDIPTMPAATSTVFCPNLCENIALASDDKCFDFRDKPTLTAHVWRSVKDRVILVGWRHTFQKLVGASIPGVTQTALERRFRVDLTPKILDEHEVDADLEGKFLDQTVQVAT